MAVCSWLLISCRLAIYNQIIGNEISISNVCINCKQYTVHCILGIISIATADCSVEHTKTEELITLVQKYEDLYN